MSSFRKRNLERFIPHTRISPQTGQIITSSGNLWLDSILGGGLALGSICLIEEKFAMYSKVLTKYFIAEGEISGHTSLLATLDEDPKDLLSQLPQPIKDEDDQEFNEIEKEELEPTIRQVEDNLRIAWRYNDLPLLNTKEKNAKIGHHYNLMKYMDVSQVTCKTWYDLQQQDNSDDNNDDSNNAQDSTSSSNNESSASEKTDQDNYYPESVCDKKTQTKCPCKQFSNLFANNKYERLLQTITKFQMRKYDEENPGKKLLRLCISSLASPLWYEDRFQQDLLKFLTILRAIIHNTAAVCLITIPMHLVAKYNPSLPNKIRNLAEYAIELESFVNTDETNPVYKEYNGLVKLHKMTALNALNVYKPETSDLAFKLRRKRFIIEKLHLPPEIQEGSNDTKKPTISCGVNQTKTSSLDF
uniref:Elongator complex protein 4 n=1 Tax=Glossina palpalis gambiensis TaxID=67801 RepID=A0A1B0AUW4_9MUSC